VPGLTALAAPGHTIGHMAFRLDSEGASLLFTIDTAINNVVSLAMPDWHAAFDTDGPQASATRKQLFGDAASSGMRVLAYHFPFPGLGFIDTDGEGFRFIPAM
jgi:glyoxylase-like metal-dependent hydrolase (beta-lactamase superfamily II)